MTAINVVATVGGQKIPINRFSVIGGSYGSVGHAEIFTSRSALIAAKIDLIALAGASPGYLPVTISTNTNSQPNFATGNPLSSLLSSAIPNSPTASVPAPSPASTPSSGGIAASIGSSKQNLGSPNIFGGEYLSADWDYDHDDVVIHARDYAGVLVDQRRVLTNIAQNVIGVLAPGQVQNSGGISTQNQTITQIVTSIAKQFGFTPVINLQAGNNPTVGTIYGNDDVVFTTIPQSLWAVLNKFALDLGYEVYVTPKRELVFGIAGAGTTPIKISYNVQGAFPGTVPCLGLKINHNPRRNSSFRVLVISYDPGNAQLTTGRATAIGSNLGGTGSQKVQAGVWTGTNAQTIDAQFLSAGSQIPLYTFHIDGLTQAQAQTRAIAIANDIQRREMILKASIDGFPMIYPGQQISVSGNVDSDVAGKTFYVSKFHHTFSMPKKAEKGESGFMTHIEALNIAVQGTGNPLKPFKQTNAKK